MLKLYDYAASGNCYKVRLLLALLNVPYERIAIDLLAGEARSAELTAKNALQKVPVLQWPDGRCLSESNAILFHLSEGTEYQPDDAWERALVMQWLNFEQFSHLPYIGAVRFWHLADALDAHVDELASAMQRGYRALEIMEGHLTDRHFMVGGQYSIADIALYAYTHVAPEGDFDLGPYAQVRAWLERVASQPRHVTMGDA